MRAKCPLVYLMLIYFNPAIAGQDVYNCRVLTVNTLGSDGRLVQSSREIYLDDAFQADRKTGTITGQSLDNAAYPTKMVISPGNDAWAFVVTWHSAAGNGGGRKTGYLSIKEWVRDAHKPFVLVTGTYVLTGTCT